MAPLLGVPSVGEEDSGVDAVSVPDFPAAEELRSAQVFVDGNEAVVRSGTPVVPRKPLEPSTDVPGQEIRRVRDAEHRDFVCLQQPQSSDSRGCVRNESAVVAERIDDDVAAVGEQAGCCLVGEGGPVKRETLFHSDGAAEFAFEPDPSIRIERQTSTDRVVAKARLGLVR